MITTILSLLISTFAFDAGAVHEPLSDWKVSRTEDDIKISYRQVLVGDTLETREMRITFEIGAEPEELVHMFRDTDKFLSWSPDVAVCEIIGVEGEDWIMYKVYDLPWPVSTRDIVTRQTVTTSDKSTVLDIVSESGWREPVDKIKRIEEYEAHWRFEPINASSSQVIYTTVELSSRPGPRFVVDEIVESSYIKSINRLREKVQN